MPGYKPQVKSENGDMVDIPIAAMYDENGNRFTEKYVSVAAQTFTEEQKAQARANIGAKSGEGKVYRHCVKVYLTHDISGYAHDSFFSFDVYLNTATALTSETIRNVLSDMAFSPTSGKYMKQGDTTSLQDIAYVIFSTTGVVNVFHYSTGSQLSLTNSNTLYYQSRTATMTVSDFVQEMP